MQKMLFENMNIYDIHNKKILVLGEYLGQKAGGAEKSMLYIISELSKRNEITVFTSKNNTFSKIYNFEKMLQTNNIILRYLDIANNSVNLPFIRYHSLKFAQVSSANYDFVFFYDFWGKAQAFTLLKNNIGASRLINFLRSETDLGIYNNYQRGIKRILWILKYLIQLFWFKKYKNDLSYLIKNSVNITNSRFMQRQLCDKYAVESTVIYPEVTQVNISHIWNPKYIQMVGDNYAKGVEIFIKLARKLPQHEFRLYSRVSAEKFISLPDNLQIVPWVDDAETLFKDCKLLLVPSQWNEAYGRVAREAYSADVPVLVSNIGGLPEAVDGDTTCVVNDYSSVQSWITCISDRLGLC